VVQFKPGASATAEELEAHLRQHVLATHIPVHWRFVDAIPRNPSMKVDRRGLVTLFASES
jgi:acyl-coenzyme A synthetase/AMP-(fatty) acid ligase